MKPTLKTFNGPAAAADIPRSASPSRRRGAPGRLGRGGFRAGTGGVESRVNSGRTTRRRRNAPLGSILVASLSSPPAPMAHHAIVPEGSLSRVGQGCAEPWPFHGHRSPRRFRMLSPPTASGERTRTGGRTTEVIRCTTGFSPALPAARQDAGARAGPRSRCCASDRGRTHRLKPRVDRHAGNRKHSITGRRACAQSLGTAEAALRGARRLRLREDGEPQSDAARTVERIGSRASRGETRPEHRARFGPARQSGTERRACLRRDRRNCRRDQARTARGCTTLGAGNAGVRDIFVVAALAIQCTQAAVVAAAAGNRVAQSPRAAGNRASGTARNLGPLGRAAG